MPRVVLIDLSSIAHPLWHLNQDDPDVNATSRKIVERVRALASDQPHVAICCDSGKSFRNDVDATYKANRPREDRAALHHQIGLACEALARDGFPLWKATNFEADDVIASGCVRAVRQGYDVLIVSADKDLLQLVGPGVTQKRPDTGEEFDADGVVRKLSVRPEQVVDYLSLVGDKSDNVRGAEGIGPKKAADLLARYTTLDAVYDALATKPTSFTPALATSLREFAARREHVRELISLRFDVDVPFDEVLRERVTQDSQDFIGEFEDMEPEIETPIAPVAQVVTEPAAPQAVATTSAPVAQGQEIQPVELVAMPREYEKQLDPRSMKEAGWLAAAMFKSRLFNAYGAPEGVLASVMLGRELGLPAMAALRQIHIIEGKQSLSAQLMVALVLKSGAAEYFEPVEMTDTRAVFVTKRKGARNEVTLTHTIEMAQAAGLVKPNSNWTKTPTDMLGWRCQSRLCRLVYPDIIGGLYTPEELREMSEGGQA